ncbi:MAG: putative DNA methylase [Candidatus Jettenia ecosi]|uniref:Putative DNA methylase n=1 Tax=Candidatus Jettenia ecosi TaxID=2494326 RepID=A0A533QF34_9BACT|nr:MAG: putative DNA methylase [Candidatus Jettenia ecosi]
MPKGKRKNIDQLNQSEAKAYRHADTDSPLRPDIGTHAQFRKKKPPKTYRYDSSLSPALDWDGQNPARELGEWLIAMIEKAAALPAPHTFDKPQEFKNSGRHVVSSVRGLHDAVEQLKQLSKPFLNWTGKAERLSFDVPTLPLFVHERLSTKAIIETLKSHKKQEHLKQLGLFDLFGNPPRPVTDQLLKAYEYRDKWVNRMILGDSLVVMNSLLHYEGLGGQVQMIYFDPPYGIKFGSNFQPFVHKRDVGHNDDEDMTREPEMVKAYRDTWELGLHSYLTYMRDRLLLARDLLAPAGSIFVQISDENVHHIRSILDEVFGVENFVSQIAFKTTAGKGSKTLDSIYDILLWYAKDGSQVKFHPIFVERGKEETDDRYNWLQLSDGEIVKLTDEQLSGIEPIPEGRRFRITALNSQGETAGETSKPFDWNGVTFYPPKGRHWSILHSGLQRLSSLNRLIVEGKNLCYKRFLDDYPIFDIKNVWMDTGGGALVHEKQYVVQTTTKAVHRCMLMTTDPGDLVLDPTCGSGTTAYVAEQWGRRWITIDTSRVPLALARQRLLTATFPYYELKDEGRGPVGGFVYKRKQNKKGEETGGIVPHVTLKSIANNEPPAEEVLVDRPEIDNKITRVTGPFCVEATIPTPVDWEGDGVGDSGAGTVEQHGSFIDRMLEILRKSPVLHIGGGKSVTLKNIRPPAKTLSLSAEAIVANGDEKPVALLFGPENGAVSEKLVHEALKEVNLRGYTYLYVIGVGIQSNARILIENAVDMGMIPATYVQATPDIMMGDLLKNMRSSQIFSVCGLPEVRLYKVNPKDPSPQPSPTKGEGVSLYQVELLGLDVLDPVTMDIDKRGGNDVPAWFLDTDYNGLCFHVCQAFFPRTSAWDNLKRALKSNYDESVWEHLAGTKSIPFEAGEHGQIAVKVIDDRGNELMVVKNLKESV